MSISTTSPTSADKYIKYFKTMNENEKRGYRYVTSLECVSCKARFTLRRPPNIDTSEIDVSRMERRASELRKNSMCQNCGGRLIDLSDEEAIQKQKQKELEDYKRGREQFLNSAIGQEREMLQEKVRKLNG